MATTVINKALTQFGVFSAHPAAFVIVGVYAMLWFIFSPATLEWHAGATMAALFMTLFIQRATHRDTQAIQAKLDELLRVHGEASNALMQIDEREPEEIVKIRDSENLGR
jgi:low affinity Fe/Cu permease